MREGRDFALIFHINERYSELKDEFSKVNSAESFSSAGSLRKAILFDFFQIGELINQLSRQFKQAFGNDNIQKVVAVRNRIVHGYGSVDDRKIYLTLKRDLPVFIKELNTYAAKRLEEIRQLFLNKKIGVYLTNKIDENRFEGYTDELTSLNGQFQPVIIEGIIINNESRQILRVKRIEKDIFICE